MAGVLLLIFQLQLPSSLWLRLVLFVFVTVNTRMDNSLSLFDRLLDIPYSVLLHSSSLCSSCRPAGLLFILFSSSERGFSQSLLHFPSAFIFYSYSFEILNLVVIYSSFYLPFSGK